MFSPFQIIVISCFQLLLSITGSSNHISPVSLSRTETNSEQPSAIFHTHFPSYQKSFVTADQGPTFPYITASLSDQSDHLSYPYRTIERQNVSLITQALSRFSSDLYREISRTTPASTNKVFSPYGINNILGILYTGAGGDTAADILHALNLTSFSGMDILENYKSVLTSIRNHTFVKLIDANKLFLDNSFEVNKEYATNIDNFFSANIEQVDFTDPASSSRRIRTWIRGTTYSQWKEVVPPAKIIPHETKLILVNAIICNVPWRFPFYQSQHTKEDRFYSDSNEEEYVMIPFMRNRVFFGITPIEDLNAQAVILPFKDERFVMISLLPNKGTQLQDLENRIGQGFDLASIPSMFKPEGYVDLYFPKFNIESEINFLDEDQGIFQNLGLGNLTLPTANFSLISNDRNLKITDVVQKIFLQVEEGGAGVQAASFVAAPSVRQPLNPPTFKLNRPFMGYIMDLQTNTILFMFRKIQ